MDYIKDVSACSHKWDVWSFHDKIERKKESHVMGMPPNIIPTQVFKIDVVYVQQRKCFHCEAVEWREHSTDGGIICIQNGLRII